MPLSGTLDITPMLADAPRMSGTDAEPWEIAGVELLHLTFEIDDATMLANIPPALHPTLPPVVYVSVARYPDSPVGAFTLAQVRAGCRAAVLPRGFLLRAYSDSQAACDALGERWGFDCRLANVGLRRFHDQIEGTVRLDGRDVLRAVLHNPEPISGGDVQYVANINLARLPDDAGKGSLVQVDPEYAFHRAERGRPDIATFDRGAWNAAGVTPVHPVSGTFVLVDSGFPRIRFVLDPALPAVAGTRRVSG